MQKKRLLITVAMKIITSTVINMILNKKIFHCRLFIDQIDWFFRCAIYAWTNGFINALVSEFVFISSDNRSKQTNKKKKKMIQYVSFLVSISTFFSVCYCAQITTSENINTNHVESMRIINGQTVNISEFPYIVSKTKKFLFYSLRRILSLFF